MKGTFAFCKTQEAIKRLNDGDIIQNLETEQYFKKRNGELLISNNCLKWRKFEGAMTFSPLTDWRSLSNLHYYDDLKTAFPSEEIQYLTSDKKVIKETDPAADKNKKRWFIGSLLS